MSANPSCEKTKISCRDKMGNVVNDDVPMFLQEDGEKKLDNLRKELEIFVKCLPEPSLMRQTLIFLNPSCLNPEFVGEQQAEEIKLWWGNPETRQKFHFWVKFNRHRVNGEQNNWSSGFLGSRWADVELNGRLVRIAFYSRKYNPTCFEHPGAEGKNYILSIDASH